MGSDNRFRIGFFGDVRQEQAGATLFERVVESGSLVLQQVGGDRAGEMAAHRFLDSPHVTPQEILNTAADRTAAACSGRRIVAAQDTTEIISVDDLGGAKVSDQQAMGRRRDSSAMRWWQLM